MLLALEKRVGFSGERRDERTNELRTNELQLWEKIGFVTWAELGDWKGRKEQDIVSQKKRKSSLRKQVLLTGCVLST